MYPWISLAWTSARTRTRSLWCTPERRVYATKPLLDKNINNGKEQVLLDDYHQWRKDAGMKSPDPTRMVRVTIQDMDISYAVYMGRYTLFCPVQRLMYKYNQSVRHRLKSRGSFQGIVVPSRDTLGINESTQTIAIASHTITWPHFHLRQHLKKASIWRECNYPN